MYVPDNAELKKEILDEAHISAYAMHLGVDIISDWDPRFTSKFWIAFQEALGTRLLYNTTYHPQTNGQSERTIQTLEDMLRSSVLQFGNAWHNCLDLMEFTYNNSYHSSIGMAPFEALYGKFCRTQLCWSEVGERVLVGPEIVDETTQNIQVIKSNLKTAQDRQKSLADKHATDRMYNLFKVHDVFHVSILRHYVSDLSHVIPPQPLEINSDLTYDEEPVTMLDWKDKELRNKIVHMVKVLWKNHSVEEATWETNDRMREMYPRLFYGY
ncbi:hypothetical protein ACFX2A_007626 [Malus domestica]